MAGRGRDAVLPAWMKGEGSAAATCVKALLRRPLGAPNRAPDAVLHALHLQPAAPQLRQELQRRRRRQRR